MIFSFSLRLHPRGSQIPLVPDSCDSWEETIYIRLANKTTTPAVSPVLAADIWNTPELLQLSKCSPTCQVTFSLNLLGRDWLETRQITMSTSELQPYQYLHVSLSSTSCTKFASVLFLTQYLVTGCVCKGLSSSQVALYPSYHNVLILHSLSMLFMYLLLQSWFWAPVRHGWKMS